MLLWDVGILPSCFTCFSSAKSNNENRTPLLFVVGLLYVCGCYQYVSEFNDVDNTSISFPVDIGIGAKQDARR